MKIDSPPTTIPYVPKKTPTQIRLPKPLRIGFVVHGMYVAGAEVLISQLIRRFQEPMEPTIFCLDAIGPLGEQLLQEGIPIVCLNRKAGRDWKVAWKLAQEIRERQIDLVHAHQYTPFFYAALAKVINRLSFSLILTEHGRHFPDVVSPLRRSVNRLVLDRLADAVNACCQFSADAVCRKDGFSGHRIEVIENGIELDRYALPDDRVALRTRLGLDPHRHYVAMVARFHPVKDHAMLLRAFAQVSTQQTNVDLLLIGDGPLRADLEQQSRSLGISHRVQFLGIRKDVPDWLKAVDLFCLTSVSEAASLTLLEAMASRLPVVVTNVGGNPEIVREGIDGFRVPRGNHNACAKAMLHLLENPDQAQQMGQAARTRIEERYTLQRTINRYTELYKRLKR